MRVLNANRRQVIAIDREGGEKPPALAANFEAENAFP